MSETKIINVAFGKSRDATTSARYRYDYGQVIEVVGIYLPETFEARFSNSPHGESIRVIGTQNKVDVPDGLFLTGEPIYCYITVHDEATDGRTMYSIKIPVKESTERTDTDPTPVEQDVITQAIASLNNAIDKTTENVEITNTNVELAQESATNAQSSADSANASAEDAQSSAERASEYANSASESAENANNSAMNAEASAERAYESETHIGQISIDVEQFAQRAETASNNAESSATISAQKAADALNSANTASAKANEASGFANDAQSSANSAQGYANSSEQSAMNAQTYMNSASMSASQSQLNAEKTQSDKEVVESAKSNVLSAVGEAQTYATTAQSASQAIQDMNVEAVTLGVDSDVTVEKSVDPVTGAVTLTYGIPKGVKGEKGDTGSKGDPFVYSDFTPEQLASLKGEKGDTGDKGDKGDAFTYADFTPEQLASLKGEKGDKGDAFEYTDFTSQQLASLKGEKGDKGENGQDYVLTESDKQEIAGLVDAPVEDVQVNGISVVTDGVANIPVATNNNLGVVKTGSTIGILNTGEIGVIPATSNDVKAGINGNNPITPTRQHASTFYGLAKASGDTTQVQSNNAVGTYTDEAKASIQSMLGVANKADKLIIHIGDIIDSTNGIYQIDNTYLTIKSALTNGASVVIDNDHGIFPYVGMTVIDNNPVLAFGTSTTFNSTAVLSGYLIMQNDTAVKVDQFTVIPTSTSQLVNDSLIEDVVINGNSVVTNGIANIPIATETKVGLIRVPSSSGHTVDNTGILSHKSAASSTIKNGTDTQDPIVASNQHISAFYGLAKAAGDSTQSASSNAVGNYTDEAKTAIKQMLGIKEPNPQIIHQVFTVEEETKTLSFHFGKKLKKIWIGITQNSVYDVTTSMYFRLISADNTRLTSFWTPRVTHTSNTKYYARCWAEVDDFGITDMFCTSTSTDKSGYVTLSSHPGIFVIDKNLFEGIELQLNSESTATKWAVGTEFEIYALLQDGETAD